MATPAASTVADSDKMDKKAKFMSVFEDIMAEVSHDITNRFDLPHETEEHIRNMMHYNVPGGKMNRGMIVVTTYEAMKGSPLTVDEYTKAASLGWCVEWLQACFLVADDIMDQSTTRRGKPCWYKNDGVNYTAINDTFVLECTVYNILKRRFRREPSYVRLMEMFHDVSYMTELGQTVDLITATPDQCDLSRFSMKRYMQIVRYKTAYYSFYLPVALAMCLHGIDDDRIYKEAETILLDMGEFFQIQDDYLDCYGDPAVSGKIGTDIEDNKCGWLINQALLMCTPEQRDRMQANYGSRDPAKVQRVKDVYNELDLAAVYNKYEEDSFHRIMAQVDALGDTIPRVVFTSFIAKIYKRDK